MLTGAHFCHLGYQQPGLLSFTNLALRLAIRSRTNCLYLDRSRCMLVLSQPQKLDRPVYLDCAACWVHSSHCIAYRRGLGNDRGVLVGIRHQQSVQYPHEPVSKQRQRQHEESIRQCAVLRGLLYRSYCGSSAMDRSSEISKRCHLCSCGLGPGIRLHSVVLVALLA